MLTGKRSDFDTPAGTRGARPAGPFGRWLGKRADKLGDTRIGRKVYHRLMGCDALVLTTIGRKSGAERTHMVARFPGKDGTWLIVASAGGTAPNPAWYYNIAARPDRVRVEIDGRTIAVTAGQLHGADRAEAWDQIAATAPQFARFQRKTDRELPVIRLTPRQEKRGPSAGARPRKPRRLAGRRPESGRGGRATRVAHGGLARMSRRQRAGGTP